MTAEDYNAWPDRREDETLRQYVDRTNRERRSVADRVPVPVDPVDPPLQLQDETLQYPWGEDEGLVIMHADDGQATLDGAYTPSQLRAIAEAIETAQAKNLPATCLEKTKGPEGPLKSTT